MKIAPARLSVFRILREIETKQAYVHVALARELDRARLSSIDAAMTTEITHGVMTWQRLIDHWIERLSSMPMRKVDKDVQSILRMSLFQLRFLDRIPAYAILSDAVEMTKTCAPRASGFVNGLLRGSLREKVYPEPLIDFEDGSLSEREIALRLSYPDWLVDYFISALGCDVAYQTMWALNLKAVRTVRVNQLRSTREELIDRLEKEGVSAAPSPVAPQGVRLLSRVNPLALLAYRDGLCTLQGESSMMIAPLLGPTAGMRVLDACAAPGGKTTHIAELAGDQAFITAVDLHEHRAKTIADHAKRLGLANVRAIAGDAREIAGQFDAILLDAPCSGLGTIARKPDLKWSMTQGRIAEIACLQKEMLQALADKVVSGGVLLYSTCTLSPIENELQIQDFLRMRSDFTLESATGFGSPVSVEGTQLGTRILPQDFGGDGFFVAKLRRIHTI